MNWCKDDDNVKGCPRNRIKFRATTTPLNLDMCLNSEPTSYVCRNHQTANRNCSFVEISISELCAIGCVVKVSDMPHIYSPLSVVESSSGKKRLVLNLRHLNPFLWKQKFKYEDLRVAMCLFEKGDYMFSFDLKSGYHHVDIAKEHWKYLGFL